MMVHPCFTLKKYTGTSKSPFWALCVTTFSIFQLVWPLVISSSFWNWKHDGTESYSKRRIPATFLDVAGVLELRVIQLQGDRFKSE
jgi:hypothetical protein